MEHLEANKRRVGDAAAALVRSGDVVGLGSGSTARYLVEALGRALADGRVHDVQGVPTSRTTEALAQAVGIPLVTLPTDGVDIALDGADEVSPSLDAIKGLGGSLVREKIVAASARRFVLIADGTKRVARLGELAPVPVEVVRFGWERTSSVVRALGCEPALRGGATNPFVTDNGNLVLDCAVAAGFDAPTLAAALDAIPGVVDHGLFLGMAHEALLADADGVARLERPPTT